MALRIFVADDHEVVRRGICALLTAHHGWEICGEAADGREAVEKVDHLQPDIVILDIGMPALNGLEAARQILHNNSHQKIAILSITDSEQVIQEALRAGAKAYILKSDGAKDLIVAIEALQQNRTYFNSRIGQIVLNGFLNTGKTHRSNLMRKLGLHCLSELVLYAVRNNIVQVPGEQASALHAGPPRMPAA